MAYSLLDKSSRQIAAVAVLSLMLAHGLSTMVWAVFDMRPGPPPEFIKPISQIGLAIHLLNDEPVIAYSTVLAALADAGITVREGIGEVPILSHSEGVPEAGVRDAFRQEIGLTSEIIYVGHPLEAGNRRAPLEIAIRYRGSRPGWLLFTLGPPNDQRPSLFKVVSPGGFASFVAIPLLVALVSLWGARKVSQPLIRLAFETERLAILQNTTADAIHEEGALEVRQVARAFNTVFKRLQRVVLDRTEMLAAISHDLRTPLTRLELRAETITDTTTRHKMLRDIHMMGSMISSTLAFMRDETTQETSQQVDLAVMLQTICDDFNDVGADVQYEGPIHATVLCRPEAFRRAITNLIDNAVALDAAVIACLETGGGFTVTIEDNGPGISDAQKKAVFEPFFRGDLSRNLKSGGIGLGLSIVQAIVRSHNGEITLIDRHPRGLRARIHVPDQATSHLL